MQKPAIQIVPHSHIDVEWYWTAAESLEWSRDIFQRVLSILKTDPDYCFTQDQVFLLKHFWQSLDKTSRMFFRQVISEGRLELAGGMYVQPEVAEPAGECLVRQVLVGQTWLQATFGKPSRCGWLIDTFGQVPQIPQILIKAGFEYVVFFRDIPQQAEDANIPADFFWVSPDGSRIRAHWMPGGYSHNPSQARLLLKHTHSKNIFFPYGKDIYRPTEDSAAIYQEVSQLLGEIGFEFEGLHLSTASRFFDLARADNSNLPDMDVDFNPPYFAQDLRGTYDNRIELKILNRMSEQALLNAERLTALAYLNGQPYGKDILEILWEMQLFSQFHDTIGGSSSDAVYRAAFERLTAVCERSNQLAHECLALIFQTGTSSGDGIMVFNTQSFPRSELCLLSLSNQPPGVAALTDLSGKPVPARMAGDDHIPQLEFIASDLPPFGYRCYRLVPGKPAQLQTNPDPDENSIQNEYFQVKWDRRTGDITHIWDRRRQREILSGEGNAIIARQETNPDLEGAIHLSGEHSRSSHFQVSQIDVCRDGISLRVKASSPFKDCTLIRETILYDSINRIDFITTLADFQGGDVLINVSFPLALDWQNATRVYETPFAATLRPEGHFAAQTWVDVSDGVHGVALFNYGTPGYWTQNGCLELTLLRSFANYTNYQKYGRLLDVPGYEDSTQTELAREHGTHTFKYTLYSHDKGWRDAHLFDMGQSLNSPLAVAANIDLEVQLFETRSYLSASPGFLLSAIKVAEDGFGLILRGFETTGQSHPIILTVPPQVKRVFKTSLLENRPEALQLTDGKVLFFSAPHEIITLWLEYFPEAAE